MQMENYIMLDQRLKWYCFDEKLEFDENQMFDEKGWSDKEFLLVELLIDIIAFQYQLWSSLNQSFSLNFIE